MGKYTSPLYTLLFLITFQTFAQFQIPDEIEVCPTASSFNVSMDFDANQSDILTDVSNATFTTLPLGDDDFSPLLNIGFNFTFYGNTYSTCVISSNNFISFNSSNANTSSVFTTNVSLGVSSPSDIKNAILGPFQDIAPQYGGTIEYATIGTAPNRAFVARWYDIPMYNCTNLTFCSSIIFYESTNVIETHLINKPNCTSWQNGLAIHGLLNSTGFYKEIIYDADEFVNRDYGNQWTTSLEGTRFTPNGSNDYNTSSIDFLPIVSLANATMTDNLGNSYAAQQTTNILNVAGIEYVVAQANICSSSLSDTTYVNHIETDILIDNVLTNTGQICPNSTVELSVENASDYSAFSWNTGETTSSITVDQTGTYTVNSTKNGCTVSSSVTISAFPTYDVDLGNDINLCDGQSVTLNGFTSNTASYSWNTGATTSSITVNTAGDYILTGTSNDGCIDIDTVTVSVFPAPTVDLGADIEACENDVENIGQTIAGATYLWNTGATTSHIDVTSTGQYILTATIGSCSDSDTIQVNFTDIPVISLPETMEFCEGDSAEINAFYSSGATYLWHDGSTNSTYTAYTAETAWVTVTDNGCTFTDTTVFTTNPYPITNLGPDQTLCEGETATLSVQENNATYLWNTTEITQSIDVTTTGTYTVEVTLNGCTSYDTIQVTFEETPTTNLGNDVELCDGDSMVFDAFYSASATYLWQDGSTNSTYTSTTTELVWVTVTLGSCSYTDSVNVEVFPTPYTDLGSDTVACEGESVTIGDPVTGATYLWNTGATTSTIDVTTSGTYSVTATLGDCSHSDTIEVTFEETPTTNLGNDVDLCDGDSVTFDATYSASATYLWQDGSTNAMYTSNSTELVWVTVTLGNCSYTDSVNVEVFPTPYTNLGPDTLACEGETVTIGDPVTGATYLWNTGATTSTIDVTISGTYSVTATLGDCSHSDTIEVTFEETPITNLGNDVDLCDGDSVTFNASYSASATYLWHDGSTNSTYTTNSTELVWVTVALGNCSYTDSVNVEVFPVPNPDLGADILVCDGETITIGQTLAGVSYLWNTGATTSHINVTTSGVYHVTTTLGTCTDSDTIEVTFEETPVINLGNDVEVCNGDSTTFNAFYSASATYLWHDGSTNSTYTSNTTEMVSVTVTLGNCSFTDSVQMTILPVPAINLGADLTACEGETVTIGDNSLFSGVDYLWNTGAITSTIDVTTTGTYILTTTLGICTYADTIEVTFEETPTINLGNPVDICEGESTTFNAFYSTAATYLWQDGSTNSTYTSNSTELVWVTVTLGNCTYTDSVQVTEYPSPITNLGPDIVVCEGDPVTLNVQENGATYLWNTTEITQSINPTATGIYTVEVTKNGCTSYDTVEVTFNEIPQINLGGNVTMCTGDSMVFNAYYSANATYVWQDGSTNPTYTSYTTELVSVTVTLANCTYSDQVSVTVNEYPDADLGSDIEVCENVPVTLTVPENGATYLWNTGQSTQSIQVPATGYYNVEVTKNGCTSYDTVHVTLKDVPEIFLGNDTIICEGESVTFDAFYSQNATYLWHDGSVNSTYTATQSETVSVTVSLNGCSTFESVVVTVNPIPEINLDDTYKLCEGDDVTLNAFYSNTATYLWSTGETDASETFTQSGNYSVTVTDNSCSYTEEFEVIVHALPVMDVQDQAICINEIATFSAYHPDFVQYEWSTGESTTSIELDTEGWYWVEVYNANCMIRDSFYLAVNETPTFNLPEDTTLCDDEPLILDVTSEDATYAWSTGSTEGSIEITEQGLYWVNVINGCGERTDTVKVFPGDCGCEIYAPTAINYNSTSESGAFEIKADCEFIQYKLKIFNRWGQLVFTSESPEVYWVPHETETEPQDVYVYMLEYGFNKGSIRSKTGNLILLH